MVSLVKRKIKGHTYFYLVWMKRIGKKVVREKQIYVGSAEKILELLRQPLPKFTSHSYGEVALLLHVAETTGFVKIVNKHLRKISSIGDYLLLLVINRLIQPESNNGIKDWYDKTCLPLIWNKDLSFSSQNYWYYLNRLTDKKMAAVWQELQSNTTKNLSVGDDTFLYDPTNFFTYIEDHDGNELPQNGHNKQMRHEKNQVSVRLLIGEESQLPYDFKCYAGNVHDSKEFPNMLSDLKQKAEQYSKEKITLVFDKGNNSKENLAALANYYFIGSLRKDLKGIPTLLDADLKDCYTTPKKNLIRSTSQEMDVYDINCKVVVSYNEKLRSKQLHSLDNAMVKTQTKFEEIKDHRFKSERSAMVAMLKILPKKYNPFKWEAQKEGKVFRVQLSLDGENLAQRRKDAGKNVIFTNHLDWSDERIIKTYRKMYKVENQFKLLHGALLIPIKPVYHWTDQKIKAHIFLCMVALFFAKTLEHMCRGKVTGSFRDILEFAGTVRIALVQREGNPQLVFEDMTLKQQALMETFSLSKYAKI